MKQKLTQADVERLIKDPSGKNRRETAEKIANAYSGETLTEHERQLAEDILGVMARDVEQSIRKALSDNLKSYSGLSRDIALTLASDVDAVALPIIHFSEVLTDEDLIGIVRTQGITKQTAVASRGTVSEEVSDALVGTRNEHVVATLVANEGAQISESAYHTVLDDFGHNETINERIVARSRIPVAVAERLVLLVSERLKDELVSRHELPAAVALDLIVQSRERATLGLLGPDATTMEVQELADQLHRNGRLTPSIVIRALCMGDSEFFEVALSVLARIPLGASRALIYDAGPLGLPAILERALVPDELVPVFRIAVEVAGETDYDGGARDRERFRGRMLERILTSIEDPNTSLGEENAQYLLQRFYGLDVSAATAPWQATA